MEIAAQIDEKPDAMRDVSRDNNGSCCRIASSSLSFRRNYSTMDLGRVDPAKRSARESKRNGVRVQLGLEVFTSQLARRSRFRGSSDSFSGSREIFQRDTSALNERATAAVAIILIYSSPPRYKAPPCGLRLDAPVRDVTRKWCNFQLHTNKSQRVYYVRV
jgi:hypothetical protein